MEFRQQQAIYLQIAGFVCEKVLRKDWVQEDKITSIRDLAIELAVNPNTVARAYNYLESNDIIYKQRGVGYFIAPNGNRNAVKLIKQKFLQQDLPHIFKALDLLQIPISNVTNLYNQWRKDESK